MGTVFLQQLRDNMRSLRFQVSLAVLLLFFVGNGVVYTLKIERLSAEDLAIAADVERRYERETLDRAVGNWYKIHDQERGTEFIAEAGFNWFQDGIWVNPSSGETTWLHNVRTTNNWMRRFEVVDWTVIVRYVLSFLCIVLAYNAVSGELESGTLRLVLANPLARGSFLTGKFLAHLATLTTAVLLGSLLSLTILMLNGLVELNWPLWRSYLFFLLAAALFAALFLLLSMGISVLARNSASSLVFLVTAWTVLIVVIPQTSYLIATQVVDPTGRFWEDINKVRDDAQTALERQGLVQRQRELAARDNFAAEKRYVQRMREVEKEMDQLRRAAEKQRQHQYKTAMKVNLFSPGFAFQYSTESFLGAGVQKVEHFERQAWRYRRHLRDFLRTRDAADSDSPHLLFLPNFMSGEEVDTHLIPRFKATPVPLEVGVTNGVVPMIILVLETSLAFFFALWTFNRAEIAG